MKPLTEIQIKKPKPSKKTMEEFIKYLRAAREKQEEKMFGQKIFEPTEVKSIFRIHPTQVLEDYYIHHFLEEVLDPTRFTMAMEGKPFICKIFMKNGLVYQAAMTRCIPIENADGVSTEIIPDINFFNSSSRLQKVNPIDWSSDKRPVVCPEQLHYSVLLSLIYGRGIISDRNTIHISWPNNLKMENVSCNNHRIRTIYSPDGILEAFSTSYPKHMLEAFIQLQKNYQMAQQKLGFGKAIFTVLDKSTSRGIMHFDLKNGKEGRAGYVSIPDIEFINPNRSQVQPSDQPRLILPTPRQRLPIYSQENTR